MCLDIHGFKTLFCFDEYYIPQKNANRLCQADITSQVDEFKSLIQMIIARLFINETLMWFGTCIPAVVM